MIFFVLYPTVLCFLAFRHRRTVRGMAIVLTGVLLLLALGWVHVQIGIISKGRIQVQVMQILWYPYTFLVGAIGTYVAILPRPTLPGHCEVCGYDLSGLPRPARFCPECGDRLDKPKPKKEPPVELVGHPDPADVPSRRVLAQLQDEKRMRANREAHRISRERDAMLRQEQEPPSEVPR